MSIQIRGPGGNAAEVDANSNLEVRTPTTEAQAGFVQVSCETDAGSVTGTRRVLAAEVNADYALRVCADDLLDWDKFEGTAINGQKWVEAVSTFTFSVAAGVLVFNTASSTTASAHCRKTSYATYPMVPFGATYFQFRLRVVNGYVSNKTIEVGCGFVATTAAPTDGLFFRWNTSGALDCVRNYNGTESTVAVASASTNYANNTMHSYIIEAGWDYANFWIDGVIVGRISSGANGEGMILCSAPPATMRVYNAGVSPASAPRLEVSDFSVYQSGANQKRDPEVIASMAGRNSMQGFTGAASTSQTANYANSAAPASATLSNTAAGYTTLGGQWQFAAVAGAETDYALFGYQVDAVSTTKPSSGLMVTGVRIEAFNTVVAVATTSTVLQWAIGVGSTAVSLATTDAVTTRGPKRIPLGVQTFAVGAVVGALAAPIDVNFDSPLFVEQGTFLHIILKMPIATATATEIFRGVVRVNGYWT